MLNNSQMVAYVLEIYDPYYTETFEAESFFVFTSILKATKWVKKYIDKTNSCYDFFLYERNIDRNDFDSLSRPEYFWKKDKFVIPGKEQKNE